ncbi:unnamed protein product [Triticum aestivum]|uniref:Subtilisin-like protease n=2 Tax=Triticum aestivum TaxID=4565 RepID=A0A9R1JDR2_WHEAT|nr:subtilisin-like protease SBT2.4 [Triticum aestivum]KAF7013132.1 hypothetical protein CFC21_027247 [Triticum aestivum]SPT15666.1 unnamed protein product [Triticum aestivum]
MSRPCCHGLILILATVIFFAPPPLARAAAAKLADVDDHGGDLPADAIYLVLLRGEPHLKAPRRRQHDNATWYHELELRAQEKKKMRRQRARLHDGILRRAMAGAGGSKYRKLYSFHHAVNGFAVHVAEGSRAAERLRAAPEVAAVEEDKGTRLMTTYTPRLLGLPGRVWRHKHDGGGSGEGVLVGVVDTGVDPAHPSFAYVPSWQPPRTGVCSAGPRFPRSSCNGKIVTARYFADGAAAVLPLDTSRDLSPFDADGHGSHVASIAVGNRGAPVVAGGAMYGFASGMAPHARLAVYKAMYPAGGTTADLISAIDQAVQDEVDVLVLSIGPDARPPTKVTFLGMLDVALLFARRAGVFVAQAAGNGGPAQSSVTSYSPWVTAVAAGTTGRTYTPWLVLGNNRRVPGLGLSAPTPGGGLLQHRLVAAGEDEECQDAEALRRRVGGVVHGNVVLCSFSRGFYEGRSTVAAVITVAEALGLAGFVLLADARYGDFVAQPIPFPIPGVMVPRVADAHLVWSYYAECTMFGGLATAAITEGRAAAFTDAAPVVARYSSRGPDLADAESTPADVLKPDVLAPGDQIWAAWSTLSANEPILAGNHFAMISGTSMAAPHVGGVAALIKQRHPSWGPSAIASALSTTALRHDNRGRPIMAEGFELGMSQPATPFDCGAGFINPAGAMDPGLVLESGFDDYISFLCSLPQLSPDDVRGATGETCQAALDSPADLNLPSITVSALQGSLTLRRRVTNVASNAERYLCSALPPDGVVVGVRPGWFDIAPGETQEVVIEMNVSRASGAFSFGEIVLTGSLDHLVRLPLAVRAPSTT